MGKRLAVFSLVEWSFSTVRRWAADAGHEISLFVTQPGSESEPGIGSTSIADPKSVVMVVPKVADCVAALTDLDVDLAVVFTFRRVPERVASIPRYGCVNVHPSLLPIYRGANGYRTLYSGAPRIGATLHYLTPEFDAGPILAQASVDTPQDVDPSTGREALVAAATMVLERGVPRALAGEPGELQDASAATDAPKFTEDEMVLSLSVTSQLFHCRSSALMLAGIQPFVALDGERQPLRAARRLPGLSAPEPGVISVNSRRAIVAVTDGVLELEIGKLPF